MGYKDTAEYNIQWDYPGTDHPVNSPFDYSFEKLPAAGGDAYPNSDSANHGFIVTGFQSSDGLSRCVIAELPTKPVQSLAELQNWDMRYENPIPPYAFNIIGNSDATPLLPANAVFNTANASLGPKDLQHDDFYCANHVLFDDWFASSIAPKSTNLGTPAVPRHSRKPSPTSSPAPIPLAQPRLSADPSRTPPPPKPPRRRQAVHGLRQQGGLLENHRLPPRSGGHVQRQLHLRQSLARIVRPRPQSEDTLCHPYRKHPLRQGRLRLLPLRRRRRYRGQDIGTSGGFSSCAEFAGYRKLDDATLDRFAEEIVKQVRARGPFLSLAEFVNRQLSSGDLALAGTIQAALNACQGRVRQSLRRDPERLQTLHRQSASRRQRPIPIPGAAVGYNAYGLPGWTRQADVLRPIAPILSARDDTFTIRAYGDARDTSGKTITARATCEASSAAPAITSIPRMLPTSPPCRKPPPTNLRPPLPNHLFPLAHRRGNLKPQPRHAPPCAFLCPQPALLLPLLPRKNPPVPAAFCSSTRLTTLRKSCISSMAPAPRKWNSPA